MHEPASPLLVVAGPTAGGKSSLAISLARALRGAVINIDSVQLYRSVDIGSAKVLPSEQGGVPHYGIDVFSPDSRVDAGIFTAKAREWLDEIRGAGQLPVVVAGTTMYFAALMGYLDELPPAEPALRERLEAEDTETLYRRLQSCDPVRAAELHPNDRTRIIRALEIVELSGQPVSMLGGFRQAGVERGLILVLWWPREALYSRINQRSEALVRDGLLEETRTLAEHYGETLAAFKAVGYAQARSVLRGEMPQSDLVSEVAQATRRFAKRQLTFWWNEPRRRGWEVRPVQPGDSPADGVPAGENNARAGYIQTGHVRKGVREAATLSFDSTEALVEAVKSGLQEARDRVVVWYLNPIGLLW